MTYVSSCFHAFALCTASKSSVESTPAFMVIDALPPGCDPSFRYAFTSYTLPFTTSQQSFSSSCFSTSAREINFAPGGGGVYPTLTAGALSSTTSTPSFSQSVVCSAWFSGICASSPARSVVMVSTFRFHPPLALPIHPPGFDAGSVGCSQVSQRSPELPIGELFVFTRNHGLFPMPIRFQVKSRGCVLLPSSQARHMSSSHCARASQSMVYCQCAHDHCLPYMESGGCLCVASRQLCPPSTETSTRVMLRPPPVYAYPFTVYSLPGNIGIFSSCAGDEIALLMFSSLKMYSGFSHHPSCSASSLVTCGGRILLSLKW
mmetsp:Transcript_5054/g.18878  ORF Transcript_5054/g.18878 Transcript_5054/m.18878 type:complete len:318 (+) Transcript_5054:2242-3195(+)